MFKRPSHLAPMAAIGMGFATIVIVAILSMTGRPADAQGVMSAPACQCSAPTTIPGMSTAIVHCLCGGMACVITEQTGSGKNGNLLQCVK
ncbi:hypothetical protein [Rhodoferax sp. PAMC 29310]|uniref:hypothetical protein n=1 Tax=Rhodoferax sp. PAMC 29310 TaxID=2822760 RepID=UPI001B321031|nr:hypothetical protein [Rhodoferax sp. PAMC 29310]